MALGLAFAAVAAAPAAAKPGGTVTAGGWTGTVNAHGVPLSAGIPTGNEPFLVDPYLTDAVARQGEALTGPDGGVPTSELAPLSPVQANADAAPADRSWGISGSGAITLGIGVLGLALALGLAAGRRPRIAGL
jgi:hypothetical protein